MGKTLVAFGACSEVQGGDKIKLRDVGEEAPSAAVVKPISDGQQDPQGLQEKLIPAQA